MAKAKGHKDQVKFDYTTKTTALALIFLIFFFYAKGEEIRLFPRHDRSKALKKEVNLQINSDYSLPFYGSFVSTGVQREIPNQYLTQCTTTKTRKYDTPFP